MSRALTPSERDPQESTVEVTGEVLGADLRRGELELWPDDQTCVVVVFPPERESEVMVALRGHRMLRLRVTGRGEYSPEGALVKVTRVREMLLRPAVEPGAADSGRTIEEKLAQIGGSVPDEDWARLPADLSDQLDHYIYGTPKR